MKILEVPKSEKKKRKRLEGTTKKADDVRPSKRKSGVEGSSDIPQGRVDRMLEV